MTNWTNKWVLMLLSGIVIQAAVYSLVWLHDMFAHNYMSEVLLIAMASVAVQSIGFRPFQHKLREEDEDLATRKPTF